jgi:hypothetical protein
MVSVLLIPVWIGLVNQALWPMFLKRTLIVVLFLTSAAFTAAVLVKPGADLTTGVLSGISVAFYFLIVSVCTYINWPR